MVKLQAICLFFLVLNVGFTVCDNNASQSVPQYLALVADTKIASAQVQDFIVQQMANLKQKYPEAAALIDQDMKSLSTANPTLPWQNPADFHTTVFYLGYDPKNMESEYYKQFVPGKTYTLQSSTFVYVPGAIMCTPVFPAPSINIANKCPHITLKIDKFQAFQSNAVLESLFTNNGPLQTQYQNGFFMQQEQTLTQKIQNVKIGNDIVDIYIIKTNYNTDKHIDLKATSQYCDDAKPKETSSTSSKQLDFFLSIMIAALSYLLF
ncbi:hypothetical protein TTHERM_00155600 (macronuclear) [Tetrahymena thermophila SB210]|uniref:Transmembrane protein n=1 Tax=Tetrahymena thermophila (strain SB210) TaxID=312017 RepID=Q22WH6_TETTS|nr:hypothetical protein TTHERM_00155600 [Tetrahymena thermophila SB210]EAR89441.1 hypothetical protein TTHERM_00155600 [Tetrahymena thermophila SB210]|eukprot:XP_001009686.1 hypothetical protein TTHERM_00155600 [Tetrahymena thermophila SB210]